MRSCKYLLLLCSLLATISCHKDDPPSPLPSSSKEMTVLVYMAANNDLQSDALDCINKMELAAKDLKGNLIVFIKTNSAGSCLLKIKFDNTEKIVSDTIRRYGVANSSDPAFFKTVIDDAKALYTAKSYGLVIWSHATSWAPAGKRVPVTKAFGSDDGLEMDIQDFKNALPDNGFTYLLFDACLMGSAEVVYELKNKAKYILASPSEVLSTSYPYEQITPYLFGGKEELITVARLFVNSYRQLSGAYASANAALIDCSQLDSFALKTKSLLDKKKASDDLNRHAVQRMDFDQSPVIAYDFLSFLQQNYTPQDIQEVESFLSKVVIYKDHTSRFLGKPVNTFSGLSVYLPVKNDPAATYYSTLMWYSSAGFYNLFNQP